MSPPDLCDAHVVRELVARFANSFDLKAWDDLGACLASTLHTDYSDLRGAPPETMPKERFVEQRRTALANLSTHHVASNVEMYLDGPRGEVKASMVIYRRDPEGQVFNTHCHYTFGVEKADQKWIICSIMQKVLWNEGQRSIHRGVSGRDD